MDEGRKRTLAVIVAIIAGPELRRLETTHGSPQMVGAIGDAITIGERIMHQIDSRYPKTEKKEHKQGPYPWGKSAGTQLK